MNTLTDKLSNTITHLFRNEKCNKALVGYTLSLAGVYLTVHSASFLWKYYLRPFPSIRNKYGGSWAVITGATGGIGLGIVHELAAEGVNIVLIARNKVVLAATAADLRFRFPEIEVRIISLDAENPGDMSAVSNTIRDLNVSLLFNNVGTHNHIPVDVADMEPSEVRKLIDVNCTFQVQLTTLVIRQMKQYVQSKTARQGRAIIVNVSSLTSKMAMPMLAVYAATKAFEEHYNECLAAELQPHGIDAMCLRPGLTVSAMSGETEPSLFCPTAAVMARACVRMLGSGEVSVVPYGPHCIEDTISRLVPRSTLWSIVRDMHAKKRADLLAKQK